MPPIPNSTAMWPSKSCLKPSRLTRNAWARFSRKAQVLASLNHPNIASIYGLEDSANKHALVLELVEGEDLSERIKRGAIPLEESLKIALQMAEALEAAHEKGIIHRDLKPANVKITPEGKVKVLDFGLAKALEDEAPATDLTSSPTRTGTAVGVIMGTAGYMSPEQARGQAVDKRTDIWAFGCVLYEVLTGKQVFSGETVTDILAAIVHKDPDWELLPEGTPRAIQRLLRRCLEKDPHDRLHHIADARIVIRYVLSEPVEDSGVGVATPPPVWWQEPTRLAVVGLMVLVAGVLLGFLLWNLAYDSQPPPPTVTRFSLPPAWRSSNSCAALVGAIPRWDQAGLCCRPRQHHAAVLAYHGSTGGQADSWLGAWLESVFLPRREMGGLLYSSSPGQG